MSDWDEDNSDWDEGDHERHQKREHKEAKEREAAKEGEVKAALEKAEKTRSEGGTVPFHTLEGHFPLYSITHFDLCYDPAYWPTRYIDFSYLDEEGQLDYSGLRARDGKSLLDGFLYLDGSIDCSLERFLPPLEASPEFFEIKEGGPSHDARSLFRSSTATT
ncbi:hypothetical protein B0J15DRAFT_502729 [Fusarium solani]|uniref:Uncharacterized protein n=1 Tax=Fusarium solani TaxID=169388 RepID=A0A9P9JWL3_FUSSL|nr:uncharacterized protein B0J15DRAFT_502729 [Fusarium solani]KAH7239743.1 hypothetical protein B0J15DRAFT_502729 [Fusarium solani]